MNCVTVLLGGVSWLGEGSNRILFHLHVVVKSSDSALWSTGAAIKNDDAAQTRQLFIIPPPPKSPYYQMVYFRSVGFEDIALYKSSITFLCCILFFRVEKLNRWTSERPYPVWMVCGLCWSEQTQYRAKVRPSHHRMQE